MAKKLISFDDQDPGLGLPDVVEQKLGGHFDGLQHDGKNLFNPLTDVITGELFLAGGGKIYRAAYRRTVRYPVEAGQPVSLSGLGTALTHSSFRFLHFWDAADAFIKSVVLPAGNGTGSERPVLTDWMTEVAPAGAASFSINLSTVADAPLPARLQIEISPEPTPYLPYHDLRFGVHKATLDAALVERSDKNLFQGKFWYKRRVLDTAMQERSNPNDVTTDFIPVEYGKTYTISGLDPSLATSGRRVGGFASNRASIEQNVRAFPTWQGSTYTVTIDNPDVRFLVVQVSYDGYGGDAEKVANLQLQVEEGAVATTYEPPVIPRGGTELLANDRRILAEAKTYAEQLTDPATARGITVDLIPMNESAVYRDLTPVTRALGAYGPTWEVEGAAQQDAAGHTLAARVDGVPAGKRSVYATLRVRNADGQSTLPKAEVTPLTVPSAQLLYDGPVSNYDQIGMKDDYTHPSIAYSETPVAGYRYWMVNSIFPGYSIGGALWEDEDVFVSNDAKTWLRIKSPYETEARPEHAPGMTLPTHDLVSSGGRKYGFLPCPARGDTLEMSMPESARGPAIDRQMITVTIDGSYPWKHDPAILIDGGYVYVYHSFHLPYPDRPGGQNRFIVLTRTSDGVNWEGVRTDGSTYPINAETSRQIFTKDDQGRYNYLWYPAGADSNPEVVKYGDGDYEFYYGTNFARRYKGTAPWDFDFSTSLPFQDQGAGNHPGLMYDGTALYMLSNKGLHKSTDRGATWTLMPYHPAWRGSVTGRTYKKALTLGEGGKVIVADVYAGRMSAGGTQSVGYWGATQQRNVTMLQHFPSVAALTDSATNGLGDAYMDVQIDQVNYTTGTRKSFFLPYVGNTTTTQLVSTRQQLVKLMDLDVEEGDVFHVYATLMSRAGGRVSLNTLTIE